MRLACPLRRRGARWDDSRLGAAAELRMGVRLVELAMEGRWRTGG